MTLYCGIDLHSNNSMISLIDEADRVVSEKRLDNTLEAIEHHLQPFQDDISGIVVESTYNWYWLVDGLMERGYPLHLANTLAIQQYNGIKYTNDATDARFLAHLLRLKILPTGYIYPKAMRPVRDLLRRRLLLVKQRTAQLLSLQGMIGRHTGQRLSGLKMKQLKPGDLARHFGSAAALFAAQQNHRLIQQLNTQIEAMEAFVLARCQDSEQYALITSTPGIGKILGMTILLETGPIERFPQVGHYSSYARCVPSDRISNGKSKGKGNTKNGNRYLAMAFVEAAHYAAIWEPRIRRYYQRKCRKVPVMVAKKTVANKLTRACYHMLKNRTVFDVTRAFG
ncbi:MAG TPA: IS110 family transposase [Gammaproteobacteria bacterium]|nr:IS110 family transposase [Gammaproteobacteria bacterium]